MAKVNNRNWPKGPHYWIDGDILHVSIPFTWNLAGVYERLMQREFWWETALVGGPAVNLMPEYFNDLSDFVKVGHTFPGVLQRVNPSATRTTVGCPNRCKFCAIPKIDRDFKELDDWPDLPVICDNNLLACSLKHFDEVIRRLKNWDVPDFNQGIDHRLLTDYHAGKLRQLNRPKIRLACDHKSHLKSWFKSICILRDAGIPKSWIHTYALVGFNTDPGECWTRCEFIKQHSEVYPMWYHHLSQEEHNWCSPKQKSLGWSDAARKGIMGYYYKKRGSVPVDFVETGEK